MTRAWLLRPLYGGFGGGDSELDQQTAVVGLHPFLGQPALVVVSENTDHFPLEVLAGGLDGTDGRVGKEPGEVTRECGARRQAVPLHDDLLTDESQALECGSQRSEVRVQFIEAQVGAWSVEDVGVSSGSSHICPRRLDKRLVPLVEPHQQTIT